MRDVVKGFNDIRILLSEVQEPNRINENFNKTLEDFMYEEEVKVLSDSFDEQCNLGIFYAYVKLKEQEIRNVVWYVEMISRKLEKNDPAWKKIIIPFNDDY